MIRWPEHRAVICHLVDVGDDELQRTAQCMARGCTWRVKSDAKHELMDAAYRHVALMKAAQT